jgi:hypothetical protein
MLENIPTTITEEEKCSVNQPIEETKAQVIIWSLEPDKPSGSDDFPIFSIDAIGSSLNMLSFECCDTPSGPTTFEGIPIHFSYI